MIQSGWLLKDQGCVNFQLKIEFKELF